METLIALAIFAVLSLAIMTGLLVAARQGDITWHSREALDLAISRLEVEQYDGPLQTVTSNGYAITYSEEKNPAYKVAAVTVSYMLRGDDHAVTLSRVITK